MICELQSELDMAQCPGEAEYEIIIELRRKLHVSEQDKLESSKKYNEELAKLGCQYTKLHSQLQKSEALRENLEYDLAIARKDASLERRSIEDTLTNTRTEKEMLKAQNEDLQDQMNEMEEAHKREQHKWLEEKSQIECLLEKRNGIIERCSAQMLSLEKITLEKSLLITESKTRLDEQFKHYTRELQSLVDDFYSTEHCRKNPLTEVTATPGILIETLRDLFYSYKDSIGTLKCKLASMNDNARKKDSALDASARCDSASSDDMEKLHSVLDQTYNEKRVLEKRQDQLCLENSKLKQVFAKYHKEKASLLAACALMIGALFPLYDRVCDLSEQRELLQRQVETYEHVKREIEALTQCFSEVEGNELKDGCKSKIHRFRKAAIAVMAANRLSKSAEAANCQFPLANGNDNREGTENADCTESDACLSGQQPDQDQSYDLVNWFQSPALLHTVVTSMSELMRAMETPEETTCGNGDAIPQAASSSYAKLISNLRHLHDGPESSESCDRQSASPDAPRLSHCLARGLDSANSEARDRGYAVQQPIMKSMADLKNQIIHITKILRICEEDRRMSHRDLEKYTLTIASIQRILEFERLRDQLNGCSRSNVADVFAELQRRDKVISQIRKILTQLEPGKQMLIECRRPRPCYVTQPTTSSSCTRSPQPSHANPCATYLPCTRSPRSSQASPTTASPPSARSPRPSHLNPRTACSPYRTSNGICG